MEGLQPPAAQAAPRMQMPPPTASPKGPGFTARLALFCSALSCDPAGDARWTLPKMPSYEPTPKRFSMLSVSQSASRRTSFDDTARPAFGDDTHDSAEPVSHFAPVDFIGAIKQVQNSRGSDTAAPDGEKERGRSRKIEGDRSSTLDQPGAIKVPSARRETSESTRQKIAMWEERSRSQSKGRSKSRGRDLGAGSRISVVPEVPELAAVLSQLQEKEAGDRLKEPVEVGTNTTRVEDDSRKPPEASINRPYGTQNELNSHLVINVHGQAAHHSSESAWEDSPIDNETKFLPEPLNGSDASETAAVEQPRKHARQPAEVSAASPKSPVSPQEIPYTALAPGPRRLEDETVPETAEQFHLPSGLLTDAVTEQGRAKKAAPAPVQLFDNASASDANSHYHEIWKVTDYAPEFPLPSRPSTRGPRPDLTGNTRLDGTPLKELPRSQLSAVATPYQPQQTLNPYPHPRDESGRAGVGQWAIDIPPSPSAAYVPEEDEGPRPTKPRRRSRTRQKHGGARFTDRRQPERHEWDAPPVIERAIHAASVSMIQGLTVPVVLYRGLRDLYYPPPGRPDIIKAYPVRRRLPVRIFFPTLYDLTSPALLPTVFTIHGGGFTVGASSDDDIWNRNFCDSFTSLVISLNYAKAPWAAFPNPLLDAEALYHAVLNDESLPIDRMRTALCGFDAGANLALGLSQLPSVRTGCDPNAIHPSYPYFAQPPRSNPPPAAVISVCGILDFSMSPSRKARTRPYKRQLRGPRGWGPGLDWMARMLPSSAWSYIPYGHEISDPLLSPAYASRADLPPHVFVVAAELDCLAHESWRAASVWAGRAVPDTDVPVGRRGPSQWRGCLDDGAGDGGGGVKFGWTETHTGGGSTRWLLVPDVVHGFDSVAWRNKYLWGDEEARMDAEMKTIAYQREVGEWLWTTVWS
ncbi:Alpha/Beta hydrolase protein [Lasiosphaeria ovina]|uniref:Alpha/Beta hydrolase protein n=1 Tax=Lasiosphaeria ovina TaxID=92902 RepID=A0AAE0NDU2_9PEZI|nr:Alpha/Beta hydrolase protein [Lasiosphaeria ovina]